VSSLTLSHCSASAENIARIYNLALGSTATTIPNSSRLNHDLHGDLVLDSFFLHALLRHWEVQRGILSLPHHGLQRHRFDNALNQRNYFMAGTGQEMWAHACSRCMKLYIGDDGNSCERDINTLFHHTRLTLCPYQIVFRQALLMVSASKISAV
jgi:hypothetical protein